MVIGRRQYARYISNYFMRVFTVLLYFTDSQSKPPEEKPGEHSEPTEDVTPLDTGGCHVVSFMVNSAVDKAQV